MKIKRVKKSKEAEMSITQLISLILVLVVIVLVFISIFKPQIWDWARSLPDYKYNNSDKEIKYITEDKVTSWNYLKIAKILDGKTISFCLNDACDSLSKSKLYITGNGEKYKIRVVQFGWNDLVGEMIDNKIKIYEEILNQKGNLYDNVKNDLPEHDLIVSLDGTIYSSGTLYRVEQIEVIESSEGEVE
jgi:hypothetical protein